MCLDISLFSRRRKAKKDIHVFKVLVLPTPYDGNEYEPYTPYVQTYMPFGSSQLSKLVREMIFSVEEGIHTFETQYAARILARQLARTKYRAPWVSGDLNLVVVECTIPKGAYYYKGTFGSQVSYASNKLVIGDGYVSIH